MNICLQTSYTHSHNNLYWSQKQRKPEWMKLRSESKQFLDMKMEKRFGETNISLKILNYLIKFVFLEVIFIL